MLAAAVGVAYANSLHVPFLFDDLSAVVGNYTIRNLTAVGTALSPTGNSAPTAGRPVLNLSFAINYALGGLDVTGYHLLNIAVHLVCTVLLFLLVRAVATHIGLPGALSPDAFAFAVAGLWATHPIQTGAVTYVSGRSESLMAMWYLAAVWAALMDHYAPNRRVWKVVSVCACAVGMACKESMVTAPIAILLLDRAYVVPTMRAAFRARRGFYGALCATAAVLLIVTWGAPRSASAGWSTGVSVPTYLLNQAVVIPEYLRLVLWPRDLFFAFGEVQPLTIRDVGLTAAIVPALVLGVAVLWYRSPALGYPIVWTALTLAPTSSIVPIATEAGALRRMYLPLAGIIVLIVLSVTVLTSQLFSRRRRTALVAAGLCLTALAMTEIGSTRAQNAAYLSEEGLWRTSLERWPSALAHRNLATALKRAGKREEVVVHLRATLATHPEERYTVGVELLEQGRVEEAISELRRVLMDNHPDPALTREARIALGRALLKRGDWAEAASTYADILAVEPRDVQARMARAEALFTGGNCRDAAEEYRQVLEITPDDRTSLTNLGICLIAQGQYDQAVPILSKAAAEGPATAGAELNVAVALFGAGRFDEAEARAGRATALDPANARARDLYERARAAGTGAHTR